MHWSDIPFNPPVRMLRQFALLCLTFLHGAAVWQYLHHQRTAVVLSLLASGCIAGLLGFLSPTMLRPLFVGSMILAFPFGWIVSRLMLAVLFFGIFTPIALIFRITGRDALALQRQDVDSYWVEKPQPSDVRCYFRQF